MGRTVRHFRRKSWGPGFALVAAYMLVLQAMLGAFALGAAAASPVLDTFGNPLCIVSTDEATMPDGGQDDHGALPDCCGSLCGMLAPLTAEDRAPRSLSNPLSPFLQVEFAFEEVVLPHASVHHPGNPRAPPVAL